MKTIVIESLSIPDQSGYNDKIAVVKNNDVIFHCQCSTCPNPYKPFTNPPIQWRDCYAWIACNTLKTPYSWKCVVSPSKGRCILVNNGGEVPTRYINKNRNAKYAIGIMIHKGYSDTWRGSAGCITIPPLMWDDFIKLFIVGETGNLYIKDSMNAIT